MGGLIHYPQLTKPGHAKLAIYSCITSHEQIVSLGQELQLLTFTKGTCACCQCAVDLSMVHFYCVAGMGRNSVWLFCCQSSWDGLALIDFTLDTQPLVRPPTITVKVVYILTEGSRSMSRPAGKICGMKLHAELRCCRIAQVLHIWLHVPGAPGGYLADCNTGWPARTVLAADCFQISTYNGSV